MTRARRGRSGGYSRRPKPRWAWNGAYLAQAQLPADAIINLHVLYDPRAAAGDNESQVTLYRVVGNYSVTNPSALNCMVGFGVYLMEQNDAGGITTSTDPLGNTFEEIGARNCLYHRMDFLRPGESGGPLNEVRLDLDIKVRRIIDGRHILIAAIRGDNPLAWQYAFALRALIREGTR